MTASKPVITCSPHLLDPLITFPWALPGPVRLLVLGPFQPVYLDHDVRRHRPAVAVLRVLAMPGHALGEGRLVGLGMGLVPFSVHCHAQAWRGAPERVKARPVSGGAPETCGPVARRAGAGDHTAFPNGNE